MPARALRQSPSDRARPDPGEIGIGAPQRNRARPALLERRIVEKGVGIGVEDLVRHGRGRGRIHGHGADFPALDLTALPEVRQIHRFVQAVVIVSSTSGWSGSSIGPTRLSWHMTCSGKDRGQKIFGAHPLHRHRHLLPAAEARSASARAAFQRHRLVNIGDASAA